MIFVCKSTANNQLYFNIRYAHKEPWSHREGKTFWQRIH